jgi:hypothetical protein
MLISRARTPWTVAVAAGVLLSVATAETQLPNSVPAPRSCATMASVAGGVALYGGASPHCGAAAMSDSALWRWTGSWSATAPNGPGPREDVLLASDPANNTLLLYGGRNGPVVHEDTWLFRGGAWSRVSSSGGPGKVEHASMAFDESRRRVVVFGGGFRSSPAAPAGMTWEWDGSRWIDIKVATSPSPRVGHSMTWSPAHRAVLLYGGFAPSGSFRDLWSWDGERWTLIDSAGPTDTEGQALTATTRGLVVVGPHAPASGDKRLAAWRYADGRWSLLAADGPPVRIGQALAYDATRQRVVVFGGAPEGSAATNETWELDLAGVPAWVRATR